jgi:hypothetical protein
MPVLKKQNTTIPSVWHPNIVSLEQAKLENFHQYLSAEIRHASGDGRSHA